MERELPEGWVLVSLNDIADWGSGGTPNRAITSYYGGDIPWVKTGDLNDDVIIEASEFLTQLGLQKSSAKVFPRGSVAIAMYGATIGKTALFGINAATNQACAVAQVYEGVENSLLHYFLKSQKDKFIEKGKGGAQPNISQTVIKLHEFPLPPLAEQKRIVAKLDEAFQHHDTLKAKLERIPELLKNFRQAVLTQAVTGKLTEDWRQENKDKVKSIKGLLLKSKHRSKGDKSKLEEGWEFATISELASTVSGFAFKSSDFVDNGLQVIRMGNLYQDRLNLERNPTFVPIDYDERIVEKYKVQPGDILLSLTGTKYKRDYGYAILIPEIENIILVNQRILSLRPVIDNIYFLYLLRNNIFRDQFFSFETGGVNQGNVGSTAVETIELPIPPLEEQKEIVKRVEALFAKADAIEGYYTSLKQKIDKLPQALLAKAFRGELVPQDPNDEPASVLLEKIKAAKAGAVKAAKGEKAKGGKQGELVL